MYEDETYIIEALRAGMHGYVRKSQTATDLIETIKGVARGAVLLSQAISPAAVDTYASGGTSSRGALTGREQQILKMIAEGKTNRAIADALGLSVKTVESHRSKIMQKLNIHRTAELIRYSIRHKIISP
jgi:DNA-binding NarL/FixJ family response regulator